MDRMEAQTSSPTHDPMRALEGMRMYIDEYGSNVGISPLDTDGVTAAYKGILAQTQDKLENTMNWVRRYTEELNQLQHDDSRMQEEVSRMKAKNIALKERKKELETELEETRGKLKKAREQADKLREMVEKNKELLKGILPEAEVLERDVRVLFEETTLLKQHVNPMIKRRKELEMKFDAAWGKKPQEQEEKTTAAYEDNSMEVLGHSDAIDLAALSVADRNGEERRLGC